MLSISIQQVTNIVTNNMTPNNVIILDTSEPEVLKCLLSLPQCMLKDGVRIYNTYRHLRSIKNDLAIEITPDTIFLWVLTSYTESDNTQPL